MGPGRDENSTGNDGAVAIELLQVAVDEWFQQTPQMPTSLKDDVFWRSWCAMLAGSEAQVGECLKPLLEHPIAPILAVMVRARLRRFGEQHDQLQLARDAAQQEQKIAQGADDEHFKVLALSALVPFLSRTMDVASLSKEITRIALLGAELCNRTLDDCLATAARGESIIAASRRAAYVCTTIEGFQNLHLWLFVHRLLDQDFYELGRDHVARRELNLLKMFSDLAKSPESLGQASFFRMLAAWELADYERRTARTQTSARSPEQWREAAIARAKSSKSSFLPDQQELAHFATLSLLFALKPEAIQHLDFERNDFFTTMRLAMIARIDARLSMTDARREESESVAQELEQRFGLSWPHYQEHLALSDLW